MPSPFDRLRRRGEAPDSGPAADVTPKPPSAWAHARAVDWPGELPPRKVFRTLTHTMREQPDARVAVVAGPEAGAWQALFERAWPKARVEVVHEADEESEVHVRLTLAGPLDVVVQAADMSGLAQARLFRRVFFHLREGGCWVTPRVVPLTDEDVARAAALDAGEPLQREDGPREPPYVGDVWDLVQAAQAARLRDFTEDDAKAVGFRDVRGLGQRLAEVHVDSKMLRVVAEKTTHPKLTGPELDAVLRARPGIGTEVASEPATEVVNRVPVVHNLGDDPWLRPVTAAPRIALREYHGAVCSRGQVVTSDGLVLPDSFRFPTAPRMTNIYVEESAPRFGHVRRDVSGAESLPGVWFHLDSEWPGQFGHMLTERLGRMWAWEQVRRDHPDVRVLMTPHDRPPFGFHQFELDLFEALEISPDRVHLFEEPCRPEVLLSADSMFSLSEYVHPRLAEVWQRVGDRLAAAAPPGPRPERLFLTRSTSLKRACHNAAEVEALFAERGFEVIRPEEHSLPEQVAMLRAADVVGGFAGSGLFTLAFRPEPTTAVTVGPTSYTARNEQLIAAVLGHRVIASWSEPDVDHPAGSWTQEAFFSDFTVDLAREGAWLAGQLDALD